MPNNKRQKKESSVGGRSNKRQKKSVADDLVCPITLELPWDPVTAEDGRVYERKAIVEHFKTASSGNGEIKSPLTNEKMGKRLLPAPHIKNLIETSIENGYITGDLADVWNKKAKEKKIMEDLLKEAVNGDTEAMLSVADYYYYGENGLDDEDDKAAYSWYKKAHHAGSVYGTGKMGLLICNGEGVTKCTSEGLVYISVAAAQGSDWAACLLGFAFADGQYGLHVNKEEAIHWLQKSLSTDCPHDNLTETGKEYAQRKLDELLGS